MREAGWAIDRDYLKPASGSKAKDRRQMPGLMLINLGTIISGSYY